ncbi:MAG TPA: DUF881 domain-containing protein [Mycobacteriales bacterium]|nr:DUF881 domain-containing protein [Mycobacteriales bacterium]
MRGWRWPVTVVALLAGVLFATSASTAQGTDLRAGRRLRLTELIAEQQQQVRALDARLRSLSADVSAATDAAARRDSRVRTAQDRADALLGAAGLLAVTGPGLEVTLDDAPRVPAGQKRPGNPSPDDLVVHEQDVLAVLNAMWAGGAEAVTIMGDRVVTTSSVRCVGNTLLLHGTVYSPPFRLAAIGDATALADALDEAPGVQVFRSYVDAYGLGYRVTRRDSIAMPGYDGPLRISAAVSGRR